MAPLSASDADWSASSSSIADSRSVKRWSSVRGTDAGADP